MLIKVIININEKTVTDDACITRESRSHADEEVCLALPRGREGGRAGEGLRHDSCDWRRGSC